MAGFTSGEGCFYIRVSKNSKYNTGFLVQLKFQISQHTRNLELLQNFFTFFKCGSYNLKPNKLIGDYIVIKLFDLDNIIIPIFDKYPILGIKSLDYRDFKKSSYFNEK